MRALQGRSELRALIGPVLAARDSLPRKVPVLLKVAPDLTEQDKRDIALVVTDEEVGHLVSIQLNSNIIFLPSFSTGWTA